MLSSDTIQNIKQMERREGGGDISVGVLRPEMSRKVPCAYPCTFMLSSRTLDGHNTNITSCFAPLTFRYFLQAIGTTCDELKVQWQKEYFGAW